jgi:hypothetical protein
VPTPRVYPDRVMTARERQQRYRQRKASRDASPAPADQSHPSRDASHPLSDASPEVLPTTTAETAEVWHGLFTVLAGSDAVQIDRVRQVLVEKKFKYDAMERVIAKLWAFDLPL